MRVVKGYHAESREEEVFSGGVQRLLDNVLKTLTVTSLMSLSGATLAGMVSAVIMFLGARQIIAGTMTLGTFITYVFFLGLMVAPVIPDRCDRNTDYGGDHWARAHARDFERVDGRPGSESHSAATTN